MPDPNVQTLLSAFTANQADILPLGSAEVYWHGGLGQFDGWSNETDNSWGGATMTLRYNNGTKWVDVDTTNAKLTADGGVAFTCAAGPVRVSVTGGAGKSLSAQVRKI